MSIRVAIACLFLSACAVSFQNCQGESGSSTGSSRTKAPMGSLALKFNDSSVTLPAAQTSYIVSGECDTSGYTSHRLEWTFNSGIQLFKDSVSGVCSSNGQFFFFLDVGSFGLIGKMGTLTAILVGIAKTGVETRGAVSSPLQIAQP